MSNDKLATMGWAPRIALPEGLSETYQWFLEHKAVRA